MFSFNTVLRKFRSTFIRKLHIGTDVSKYNLCAFLNSCTKIRNCQLGLQIHAKIVQYGHTNNLILSTALVDFYAKCSAVEDARRIFDMLKQHDEVSWTSILYGYSQYGCGVEANKLFKKMLESDIKPNCFTYVSIIAACSRGEEPLEQGKLVHAHVIKLGFVNHSFVVCSLIDYYSKCRNVDGASMIFYEAKTRDNVVYSSMIASYCQNFYVENAIRLYLQMRNWGINVTDTTMSSILHAATMVSNVQFGRQVHGLITKLGFLTNLFVLSSLIELYSKNGFINEAQYVFDQTIERNNVLWTSMVSGYARSGKAMEALELFDQMMAAGFLPDHVCFTAVLSACNLAGFLDRGVEHFNKMIKYYDLSPTLDEYACLIDLYARQGHLSKAVQVMDDMPFEPNCVILSAVLNSCKTYGAVELGREVFNRLFAVQPHNSAACLTMARLYAEAGLWDEAANIRHMMKPKGVEKGAAWSWVDADEQLNVS